MSLVFRGNSSGGNFVKLYPDVDRRFTDSLTSSLHISIKNKRYFQAKSNQQSIVDVSLFKLAMSMSKKCSYLVSMSDDLDENVKSSSYVDSRFDIGAISFDSYLSNNCALATK